VDLVGGGWRGNPATSILGDINHDIMGQGWSGGLNECKAYWLEQRPGLKPESADLWCQRWLIDNKTKESDGSTGWGYPNPYVDTLPYIPLYESFNDVAGTFYGGRTFDGNAKCFANSRKYYGMDAFVPSDVDNYYCYGSDRENDNCGGGFFGSIGCAAENIGGSFGDFVSKTLPKFIENGFNALGAGADFTAWILANWPIVLGGIAVLFVIGFLLWVLK
jgi:hypothetical protein